MCLSALLSGNCISDDGKDEQDGANIAVGDELPQFTVDLSNGTGISTEALKGKVSVIMLFSVTCGDCQRQFPIIEQLFEHYKQEDDVLIFGISRAQGEEEVSAFWTGNNYQMPYSAQSDRYIYSLFAKSIVPRIYISNREGVVQRIFTDNPLATYAQLEATVEQLLKE